MENRNEEQKETSLMKEIVSTIVYLLAVVALTFLFVEFVGQRTHVNGDSMNATLEDGDNLIVDKISYRFKNPERYDIIVFPYKYQEKTYYIKRIIGLPGETVEIEDGVIYIDGEVLEESYGKEVMRSAGIASEPIELGEDEYFVLGDNRNNSEDSRFANIGNVQKEHIIGKVWFRIVSWNEFGFL